MLTSKKIADRLNILCNDPIVKRVIAELIDIEVEPPAIIPRGWCIRDAQNCFQPSVIGVLGALAGDGAVIAARYSFLNDEGEPQGLKVFDTFVLDGSVNDGEPITTEELVERLNVLCEDATSKRVIAELMERRITLKESPDDSFVIVGTQEVSMLGLLGVLNALPEKRWPRVAARYSDDVGIPDTFEAFEVFVKPATLEEAGALVASGVV